MSDIQRDIQQDQQLSATARETNHKDATVADATVADAGASKSHFHVAAADAQSMDGKHSVPAAPVSVTASGLDRELLLDLTVKLAHTVGQFTTSWMAERLKLTIPIVNDLLEGLTRDGMIETLGASGFMNYRYCSTRAGRERAADLMELCGYIGPAPVPLEDYIAMIEKQGGARQQITVDEVRSAISDLILEDEAAKIAGMAVSSGRSLFMFGPAGNGKTSLAKRLHSALKDNIWIPFCISAFNNIIQLFDAKWHHSAKSDVSGTDRRWLRIKRPLIVGGGEMTMDSVELAYNAKLRYYEAPLHIKANGGTFLVDDFGRNHAEPTKLLNRWIVPLEEGIDYLELKNGQKISIPFGMMLIVATNLEPDSIVDPAFLRRMGYRLRLSSPSWERFEQIFLAYAQNKGLAVRDDVLERLSERFRDEGRELRCCHPRDLIERVQDICLYANKPVELTRENLDLAWRGYFGNWSRNECALL